MTVQKHGNSLRKEKIQLLQYEYDLISINDDSWFSFRTILSRLIHGEFYNSPPPGEDEMTHFHVNDVLAFDKYFMGLADLEYAIVDFRNPSEGGEWLQEELVCRILGYSHVTAFWERSIDGIMFTRTMIPSTRAKR